MRSGWDEWSPDRDGPALERLVVELLEEQRPVDARLVARAAAALNRQPVVSVRGRNGTQRDTRGVRQVRRLDRHTCCDGAVIHCLPGLGDPVAAVVSTASGSQRLAMEPEQPRRRAS